MAQIQAFSWTNPASAVARNLDCGFTVAEITTIDVTNGGSFQWVSGMPNAYYLDVDAGTIGTTNGFTPLAQNAAFGATISGFTNANPGVITVNATAPFGFAAGDTISVSQLADDQAGTSLNGSYTIASVTATTITTTTNTTAYSAYVSGGVATRVSYVDPLTGDTVQAPTANEAIRGITAGTSVVGANNAVMVAIAKSAEHVV